MRTNGYTERSHRVWKVNETLRLLRRAAIDVLDPRLVDAAFERDGVSRRRPGLQFVRVAALISTLVMASTSLPASHKLPSGPTTMWRTTPPPDVRIGHVWNFSVAGSNRTSMFGLALPSTYQTILAEAVMA